MVSSGLMIARVTLDRAVGQDFDYLVPENLKGAVEVGTRVEVPLGSQRLLGLVTGILARSPHPKLRELIGVVGRQSLITPKILDLVRWLADYYCCSLELALKSAVPQAVLKKPENWRKKLFVRGLNPPSSETELTNRQRELWQAIRDRGASALSEILTELATSASTLRRMEETGWVAIAPQIEERDPFADEIVLPTSKLRLNPEQQNVLDRVIVAFDDLEREGHAFLLHGVTGSGKTEIYLQAIAHCLSRGKGAIVLVPEISLTPQTVERFKARFSDGEGNTEIAVLHSHLSTGERHDEWHKIRQGRARIVIGARSAIFAPVDPLGLVIVDEEHDSSYKQEETPRYHARDLAVLRAKREKAIAILGSATPSLESYRNVELRKYILLNLPNRVDSCTLPLVRIVDMRLEARGEKGIPIFSRRLKEAISLRLEAREQVMLLINRRGYASSLQCLQCGYVVECPHCSVSLTYHRRDERLLCHICGHLEPPPNVCPQPECGDPGIRYRGVGTQRVEETLGKLFPKARVKRMDSDVLKRKEDYRRILDQFRQGKIDILLGTQMIAKGLHFPNVTLVGIVYADLSLHIPDFRAGERTFQLLTQVAGRAGRGEVEGEVFVQSFTPFHPAIQYARQHDYLGFYEQELEQRQEFGYPPFNRLCALTLRAQDQDLARLTADHVATTVRQRLGDLPDLNVLGPAPAVLLRAETFYRYQIVLRTGRMPVLARRIKRLAKELELPEGVRLTIDVDPVHL